ncbi:MAG TPA: hypothetical protein VJ385_20510 [Fibrobacteria bacterium]|nr:hypothetical protein [Fibrobacteria bacterium]
MGSNTDKSRQQRPLWEMLILLAFFLGLALLARVPAELGKLRQADMAGSEATRAQNAPTE